MKITHIGYFGRSTNVKDAPTVRVDAFAAAIAAMPRRPRASAEVIELPRKVGDQ